MSHPLLFYGMAKREVGPLIAAAAILYYLFTGKQIIRVSMRDLMMRCSVGFFYNVLRNTHRLRPRSFKWIVPGILFYHVPLPAIHLWSLMTLTADGWGTSMRASGELTKKDSVRKAWFETGFFVVWMGVVGGVAARWAATHGLSGVTSEAVAFLIVCGAALASFLAWKVTISKDS